MKTFAVLEIAYKYWRKHDYEDDGHGNLNNRLRTTLANTQRALEEARSTNTAIRATVALTAVVFGRITTDVGLGDRALTNIGRFCIGSPPTTFQGNVGESHPSCGFIHSLHDVYTLLLPIVVLAGSCRQMQSVSEVEPSLKVVESSSEQRVQL